MGLNVQKTLSLNSFSRAVLIFLSENKNSRQKVFFYEVTRSLLNY